MIKIDDGGPAFGGDYYIDGQQFVKIGNEKPELQPTKIKCYSSGMTLYMRIYLDIFGYLAQDAIRCLADMNVLELNPS